jgi:hypothetical protein
MVFFGISAAFMIRMLHHARFLILGITVLAMTACAFPDTHCKEILTYPSFVRLDCTAAD